MAQAVQEQPVMRSNPEDKPWIVMKYGGTSVGKFLDKISGEIVSSYLDQGNRVAVVCSARSGSTKSTGTTNMLLRAAAEALRPPATLASNGIASASASSTAVSSPTGERTPHGSYRRSPSSNGASSSSFPSRVPGSGLSMPGTPTAERSSSLSGRSLSTSIASLKMTNGAQTPPIVDENAFHLTVDQIKEDHLRAARDIVSNVDILQELEDELHYDCERLRSFLLAAQIIDEISARSKDIIMGVGERLSCRIVTAALRDRGIDAELVSLESIVESAGAEEEQQPREKDSTQALSQNFYDRLSARLGERLRECENRIPVVTGFFGVVPGSLLSQVGRGYTDLCAALCAVGVSASELQVWKEVDGIFTADPRKVPTARLLSTITPEEAAELTYYGSEVIHPFTMEQVIRASIPIRIKNVENPTGSGTIIFPDTSSNTDSEDGDNRVSPANSMTASQLLAQRGPTAVTIKDNILVLSIRSNRKTISHGFFARIFGTLDKYGVIVDLISTSEVHVSMAINGTIRKSVLDRIQAELRAVGEVSVRDNMAILSLVGKHMKNMVGVAGRMFTTLAEANINLEMISQGASEINISCVIEEAQAAKALNVVHHRLLNIAAAARPHMGPWLF